MKQYRNRYLFPYNGRLNIEQVLNNYITWSPLRGWGSAWNKIITLLEPYDEDWNTMMEINLILGRRGYFKYERGRRSYR